MQTARTSTWALQRRAIQPNATPHRAGGEPARVSDLQIAQHDAAEHEDVAVLQVGLHDPPSVDERAV